MAEQGFDPRPCPTLQPLLHIDGPSYIGLIVVADGAKVTSAFGSPKPPAQMLGGCSQVTVPTEPLPSSTCQTAAGGIRAGRELCWG